MRQYEQYLFPILWFLLCWRFFLLNVFVAFSDDSAFPKDLLFSSPNLLRINSSMSSSSEPSFKRCDNCVVAGRVMSTNTHTKRNYIDVRIAYFFPYLLLSVHFFEYFYNMAIHILSFHLILCYRQLR